MVRAFRSDPVDRELIARLVDTASRAPSAGKAQGWHVVVLEGAATEQFWSATMADSVRAKFRWKHLLAAPVIALSFADPHAYLERYSEPDKSQSGLGESLEAWPVDYWTVDASFATMTFLLAAHDAGLGALFFGVFNGEAELRRRLNVPAEMRLIGAVALGYERTPQSHEAGDAAFGRGASAARARADVGKVAHFGGW